MGIVGVCALEAVRVVPITSIRFGFEGVLSLLILLFQRPLLVMVRSQWTAADVDASFEMALLWRGLRSTSWSLCIKI